MVWSILCAYRSSWWITFCMCKYVVRTFDVLYGRRCQQKPSASLHSLPTTIFISYPYHVGLRVKTGKFPRGLNLRRGNSHGSAMRQHYDCIRRRRPPNPCISIGIINMTMASQWVMSEQKASCSAKWRHVHVGFFCGQQKPWQAIIMSPSNDNEVAQCKCLRLGLQYEVVVTTTTTTIWASFTFPSFRSPIGWASVCILFVSCSFVVGLSFSCICSYEQDQISW